jgi:uncharacterized protein (DUF2267 family)
MAEVNTKFLSKIVPSDIGGEASTVVFSFGNGLRTKLSLKELKPEIVEQLAIHGLSQKAGDSASGMSKDRDFSGAYAAVQAVLDNLRNGLWSSRAGSSTSDLVTVIAKIMKLSEDEAQAKVDAATEEQLLAIKKNPQVKEAISKLQAARAAENAKSAPKLDDLMKSIGL